MSMSTIAEEAGVSKNTVSLALRHDPQIPASTRTRIERIARRLGYVRHPVVAQLMVELRRGDPPEGARRTLALLNANLDRNAFTRHPTVPVYVAGCRRRAASLGYGLDTFWLHDPELDGERLNGILRARGIRGVVVTGLMKDNRLPERFGVTWATHAVAVTGVRTHEPTLSFCCVDHHALVIEAFQHAVTAGYRRPALVVDEHIDHLVEDRFSAGMHVAQAALPAKDRVRGFYRVEKARQDPALFRDWFERQRPDAIFTLYGVVRKWLSAMGREAPRDIGLVQLERRRGNLDWAGMDQHNDLTGEAAVDMVISQLHNNEIGVPSHPRATLISGSWTPGSTVKPRA